MSNATNPHENLESLLAQTLGERLEKTLRVMNISAQDMGAYLGVSRTTISNWLHGRAPIKRAALVAWALRTGVPLEWIETGEFPTDEENPHQSPDGGAVRPEGLETPTFTVKAPRFARVTSLAEYRQRAS